jgi:hypothetical protein
VGPAAPVSGQGGPGGIYLKDGLVNKLLLTILLVVGLTLAPGAPAPAQTVAGYGGLLRQNHGSRKLGASLNHKYKSVGTKHRTHRKAKARR